MFLITCKTYTNNKHAHNIQNAPPPRRINHNIQSRPCMNFMAEHNLNDLMENTCSVIKRLQHKESYLEPNRFNLERWLQNWCVRPAEMILLVKMFYHWRMTCGCCIDRSSTTTPSRNASSRAASTIPLFLVERNCSAHPEIRALKLRVAQMINSQQEIVT